MSADPDPELTLLRRRIEELAAREARYRDVFENSPVSLWVEDWSGLRGHIDRLAADGVVDLGAHLDRHPELLSTFVGLVELLDVNRATLELCRASDKEQLLAGLSVVFNEATMLTFRRELLALAGGAMAYEEETVVCTIDGEPRDVLFRLVISADCRDTWKRCFVTLIDITERKRVEAALQRSREETIHAQRDLLARLSTPVIPISDEVLVMPFIGALDRARMQQAMGVLLEEVQRTRASTAILDITGVPEMDPEAVAGILQAAQAVKLLGAQAVLTGIRPEVAQELVGLGADLHALVTRGTMQAGIAYAMQTGRARR